MSRVRNSSITVIAATAAVIGVVVLAPAVGHAATPTTYFAAPANSGTADCSTAANACTLATAISKTSAGDTVQLAGGVYSATHVTISDGITLLATPGTTPVLDGGGSGDVITANSTASNTFIGLTFENSGDAHSGIFNSEATSTVEDCTFSRDGWGVYTNGGGVATMSDSTFTDDTQAGVDVNGGTGTVVDSSFSDNAIGVHAEDTVSVQGSSFSGNGVGLDVSEGSATLTDSSVVEGTSDGVDVSNDASLTIRDSTIADNSGDGLDVSQTQSSADVSNSTITANAAAGIATDTGTSIQLIASTISNNTADAIDNAGHVLVGASIIASPILGAHSCATAVNTDQGYDLDSDGTCGLTGPGSLTSNTLERTLLPLADNGGPTETVAPAWNSPALGVVRSELAKTTQVCGTADQRGVLRTGPTCDAGAFESSTGGASPQVSIAVTPAGGASLGQSVTITAAVTGPDGVPEGNADFDADGDPISGCTSVVLTEASATCQATLAAGTYSLTADYSGNSGYADGTYAAGTGEIPTYVVAKGDTTTAVTVTGGSLSATVTPVSPASGTPTGTVTFAVDGATVGSAPLSSGTATLSYVSSGAHTVSASYTGDSQFNSSVGSTATTNPTITAKATSAHPETAYGWYRSPVTVSFVCTAGSAPLSGSCPSPVTLSTNDADQSATGTDTDTDGGTASVTYGPVNIDQIAPTVKITGVKSGKTYAKAPKPKCVASDALSGLPGPCTLTTAKKKKGKVEVVTVTASATDRAGNTTSKVSHYDLKLNK